jgi:hypothetical protein
MKKISLGIFCLMLTTQVYSSTCSPDKLKAGFSDYAASAGGEVYSTKSGFDVYLGEGPNRKIITELYQHDEECDESELNDLMYDIEATVCEAGDKDFNQILRETMNVVTSTSSVDSTVFGEYSYSIRPIIKSIQENSSGRFCQKNSTYDGSDDVETYCEVPASSIKISEDSVTVGIPSDSASCYVRLEKRLKLNTEIVLSNVSSSVSGVTDNYTYGYATLACKMVSDSGVMKPKLVKVENEPSCDFENINFYRDPLSAAGCREICFWGQNLHCPAKRIIWGEDNNGDGDYTDEGEKECYADVAQSFIDDVLLVQSNTKYRDGEINLLCSPTGDLIKLDSGACH